MGAPSSEHHVTAKLSLVEFQKEKTISKAYQEIVWAVSFKVCRSFPETPRSNSNREESLVYFSSGSV